MMKKSEGEHSKTFKNILPPTCPTWHFLFGQLLKEAKGDVKAIPETPEVIILKAGGRSDVYRFDVDFVKARAFDEGFPIVTALLNGIAGGKNYSQWEKLLRNFYNEFQALEKNP